MTRIEFDGVAKEFRQQDGSSLRVLDNLDFTAVENDFACVIGPSGCGKSTMMNIIAGIEDPTSGSVTVGGNGTSEDGGEPNIGFVFQEPRLLDWRTVRQNLVFALKGKRIPKGEWDDRIATYLELVGLAGFQDEYPRALSGGMKQRVAIARAMAIDPDIILMDEPFSNLDEITARRLREDLVEIWQTEPKTILFVTHNALEAVYLGNRVVVLSHRPTTIITVRNIPQERPRELDDPDLVGIAEELVDRLEAEM